MPKLSSKRSCFLLLGGRGGGTELCLPNACRGEFSSSCSGRTLLEALTGVTEGSLSGQPPPSPLQEPHSKSNSQPSQARGVCEAHGFGEEATAGTLNRLSPPSPACHLACAHPALLGHPSPLRGPSGKQMQDDACVCEG